MNIPPPAGHQPTDQAAAPAQPGFEEAAQAFWEKNRRVILLVCAAALLVILGREGYGFMQQQKEREVQAAFARAADQAGPLAAFAQAHEGHVLAGVARLRLADQRYSAADYRQAIELYNQAAAQLENPALRGRARLGAAISQLYAGDQAAAETALKAVGDDAALPAGLRAEAHYHLASLAREAGNEAEVSRLVAEIGKIEPVGVWSQRATALLVNRAGN